jgi:hypothetical protein
MSSTTKHQARVAGWLYLLACLPAPFSLIYVPNTLIVPGNATATAGKILASETMFRLAMAGEVTAAIAFIFATLALYRLLQVVNKRQNHSAGLSKGPKETLDLFELVD